MASHLGLSHCLSHGLSHGLSLGPLTWPLTWASHMASYLGLSHSLSHGLSLGPLTWPLTWASHMASHLGLSHGLTDQPHMASQIGLSDRSHDLLCEADLSGRVRPCEADLWGRARTPTASQICLTDWTLWQIRQIRQIIADRLIRCAINPWFLVEIYHARPVRLFYSTVADPGLSGGKKHELETIASGGHLFLDSVGWKGQGLPVPWIRTCCIATEYSCTYILNQAKINVRVPTIFYIEVPFTSHKLFSVYSDEQ